MKRVILYILVVILGVLGLAGALRVLERLFFGSFDSYGIGALLGQSLWAVILLWGAFALLKKARAA